MTGVKVRLVDNDIPGPKRDLVGYRKMPPRVVWPDGANVAVNLVVNYEEGSEYSKPAGGGVCKRHLVVPYSMTYNDMQGTRNPADFLGYCRRGLDELSREGDAGYPKMMSVGLHPRLIGQAGRTSALREFIEHALAKGLVRATDRHRSLVARPSPGLRTLTGLT